MKKLYKIGILAVILVLFIGFGIQRTSVESRKMEAESTKAPENTEKQEKTVTAPSSGLYPDMVVDRLDFKPLQTNDKVVYITFDDGPCATTPKLLALLKKLNVKATFFVTAQFGSDKQVVAWLKQIHKDGHAIGIHSYSHKYDEIYESEEAFLSDYRKMDDLIIQATGERTHTYRFPGGSNAEYSKLVRTELIKDLNSRGIVYYDWNAYDGDCDGYSRKKIISTVVEQCGHRNRSILLMHNLPDKGNVIKALPDIVAKLRKKGYRFDVLDGTVQPIQFIK